jgi:probable HAF family extracellular repeat protein
LPTFVEPEETMFARLPATLVLLVLASPALAHSSYRLVDLGSLGGAHSCANAINNRGDAVGVSTLKGEAASHAVLWSKDKATDLGTVEGFPSSDAIGISDAGAIVGEAWVPRGPMDQKRAVSWKENKANLLAITRLEAPGGAAYDVNDAGVAVGRALINDPGTRSGARASILDQGKVTLVPALTLPKDAGVLTPELATAVNKGGVVVGSARVLVGGTPLRRPFRYSNGATSDPMAAIDAVNPSWAIDVNNAGDMAIQRVLPGDGTGEGKGTWQALIVKGTKVTEVAPLEGYANAEIRALNAKGDAVGYAWNKTGGTVPMVVQGGRTIDPNQYIGGAGDWKIVLLTDINDAGQIVGVAMKGDVTHAIRLDPGPTTALAADDPSLTTETVTWTTAFAGARPNPAVGSSTQFAFTLASKGDVTVRLTNVQGRIVRTMRGSFEAGPNTLVWDGRDDSGARVGSGVLFARFTGGGVGDTRKVIVEN